MFKKIIYIGICILVYSSSYSQENIKALYSLNDCIDIAIKNNLDLKSSTLRAETSEVNFKQSKANVLPNLNANYNLGVNNGRSIDPFTNDFINQELTFSNAGLNLNLTVFNGFRLMNTIKQNKFNMQAAEMEIEETKQNLVLDVTLAYIQILNSKDLVELAKAILETTRKQLTRLNVLYKEEVGNPADFTDMQGQYALDEMSVINAENALKTGILNLIQLLNIDDSNSEIVFESIEGFIESEKYKLSATEVFNDALENLATFKSKELRIDAADNGIKVARSNYYPEVSLFGQLNTNYSSAAETFNEIGNEINETGAFVDINDEIFPVQENQPLFQGENINYNDQFDNNLNSVVGLSVSIPLFNGFRAKNTVKLQKIQKEESLIDYENTKLLFKQSIEQAYINMDAAFKRYHILSNQVKAFEESFRINEIRFNNGVSNVVEYITSKNNLDSSRLNLSNAKYEYLLRVKILDYYRGI